MMSLPSWGTSRFVLHPDKVSLPQHQEVDECAGRDPRWNAERYNNTMLLLENTAITFRARSPADEDCKETEVSNKCASVLVDSGNL